jgi:hypothetical protein
MAEDSTFLLDTFTANKVFVSPAYVLGHLNPVTPLSLTKPLGELFNGRLPLVDALNKLRA